MEKTIRLVEENVTTLADESVVLNKVSEYDLLENAILFVPQGGHASNELLQLSTLYNRMKTEKNKAEGDSLTISFAVTHSAFIALE